MKYKFTDIVDFTGKACDNFDGRRNYISTGCLHEDSICDVEVEVVTYETKPSRANLLVQPGDILFAKMQSTKKTLLINKDLSDNIYSTGFCSVKPKDGVITEKCLYYLITSNLFLSEKDKNCSGATQKAINNHGLSLIELNIPNFEKQYKIEKELDTLSAMLSKKKRQLDYLDSLTKARFVEMFVGKDYPLIALDDLSLGKGEYGAQSASTEYDPSRPRYVRITDINDDGTLNDDVVSSVNVEDDEQYKLSYGDFMFARMGATVGKTYAYKSGNQIFAGYLIRYKLNLEKIMPEYLYAYTKLDEYKNWVVLNQSGAAQPGINAKKYGSLQIPVASLEEQKAFEDFVKQVDKSKFAIQKSLEKTQQLFDSLMQEYFG